MNGRTRRKARLETWLNAVETPVFLLSAARKVEFFNAGCERLTGWSADQVVGQICEYASEGDHLAVESLTGSLCPPPEVFQGQDRRVPAYLVNHDGQSVARLLHFFPLKDEKGQVKSILGVITPIEEPTATAEASPAQQLHAELAALRISLRQRFGIKSLICRSEAMRRVVEEINLAREPKVPVFLLGEKGTGKEHVARLIHHKSESRSRSFVPLDCGNLPALQLKQTLDRLLDLDAEVSSIPSALQPGTLYLADVECLPRDLQDQIVKAFQPGQSVSRGEHRLMAASSIDPRKAREDDRMRSDLYYLLTPLQIELPPLRRRMEDLAPLAQSFLESQNRGSEKQVSGFAEEVWDRFRQYNWPGNLDELAAVVQEARDACTDTLIRAADLPFRFRTGLDAQSVGPTIRPKPKPLEPLLAQVEKEQIQMALEQCRYNKSKAAELLGITRARLYRRMQALKIEDREPNH